MNEQTGSVELFESTQKYSCPIKTARHPGLKAYIQQIVHSLRAELLKDTVHRISVVTLNSSTRPVDRFVFEMSVLKSFDDRLRVVQQQLPQQPPTATRAMDNNQSERAEEDLDLRLQDQDQQPETTAPRLNKGKGKAVEYQRHEMDDGVEDEDVDGDDGFETGQYDSYGGDHGQEPDQEQDEQGHHAAEGEEGEGYNEEEYEEEDDDGEYETPPMRGIRAVQDKRSATSNVVSSAAGQTTGESRGYENRVDRDGARHRRGTPHFGARVDLTTDLETMLRAMLLKISICDAHLAPLTSESSFTVVVEMKNKGPGPEAKADFPWSPISPASHEEQLKISALPAQPTLQQRKIIPVKTVDVADIQLELYLEKLNG
ncbi:MAD2 mitotic arrest deficient-like 2 [Mortierella hygrophila]|uniref:MAD2 mitotic arrest deficient-like 2 n=1 Tax=Mortierella hygrophila TaxID=979708 RepID=A0A9P6FGX3_9FUNG|nr:MAD2 mitotic arrest deficient-like 2 [Mortierella hygrophila]